MGVEEELAGALVPPGISKSLKWRLAVSLSIAGILVWIAWAMGMLGLPGFALADDVKGVKGQLAEVRASLIAKEIDTVSTSLCMSPYNVSLINYRESLQKTHHDLTGNYRESPPCEVLLALKR